MDGLDTGFFFELWDQNEAVRARWRSITRSDAPAAVSTITLFEVARHGLRGRLGQSFAKTIVQRADVAFKKAPVDPTGVLNRAARIGHGMGLPRADALIGASLEAVGCDRLVTGDTDFEAYEGDMTVHFL